MYFSTANLTPILTYLTDKIALPARKSNSAIGDWCLFYKYILHFCLDQLATFPSMAYKELYSFTFEFVNTSRLIIYLLYQESIQSLHIYPFIELIIIYIYSPE